MVLHYSSLLFIQSIATHRDHFVQPLSVHLSVCLSVCLFGIHTLLVVTLSYVSQVTHAFLECCHSGYNITVHLHVLSVAYNVQKKKNEAGYVIF